MAPLQQDKRFAFGLFIAIWCTVFSGPVAAQPSSIYPFWDWIEVLRWQGISGELEALESQIQETSRLVANEERSLKDKIQQLIKERPELLQAESQAAIEPLSHPFQDLVAEATEDLIKKLDGILVPRQIERLHQLTCWTKVNGAYGFVHEVANGAIGSHLKIDTLEAKELETVGTDLQMEFDAELFELRSSYRQKLFDSVLDEEQKKKLNELIGEKSTVGFSMKF